MYVNQSVISHQSIWIFIPFMSVNSLIECKTLRPHNKGKKYYFGTHDEKC